MRSQYLTAERRGIKDKKKEEQERKETKGGKSHITSQSLGN